jgi:hypothetical protein
MESQALSFIHNSKTTNLYDLLETEEEMASLVVKE